MPLVGCIRPVVQLASVCERVRSDDNFIRIVNELRPSEVPARKAAGGASPSSAEGSVDPRLATSLDAMFGISVGLPAPITDVVSIYKGDPVPDGYVKVSLRSSLRRVLT